MRKLKYVQDRNVPDYKFKKRCKECYCVTVSNKPLMNGDPCEPCVMSNGVTKKSILTDYWKPFPDSI
jgi:hypothetical protein